MKIFSFFVCLVGLLSSTFSQSLYEVQVKTKDGMNREVVVNVRVNQDGADFTVEQASRNRSAELESGEDWKTTFNNSVKIACLFTEIMLVKNRATWVPSRVFLYWDPETKRYLGAVRGYAQNSYGVVSEIVDLVEMNSDGKISRVD